nr:MAG: nonstructural protein [Microvirus sp.]
MKLEVYAVHDSAVGAFNRPLFFRSRGEAIRSFEQAVRDEANGFGAHPEHFSFWQIGEWNDDSALFNDQFGSPDRVCGANDFLVKPAS